MGTYTQIAGATFAVEIAAPGNYDRINVTGVPGTAGLAGAISPTLLGGFKPARNQVFPGVITATGGLTGTFDTLTNQQLTPIMFWQPRYLPTSFDLAAWPDFANPGLPLTSNQSKVGRILNAINSSATGDLAGMLDTIAQLPTGSAVANAYQQIST